MISFDLKADPSQQRKIARKNALSIAEQLPDTLTESTLILADTNEHLAVAAGKPEILDYTYYYLMDILQQAKIDFTLAVPGTLDTDYTRMLLVLPGDQLQSRIAEVPNSDIVCVDSIRLHQSAQQLALRFTGPFVPPSPEAVIVIEESARYYSLCAGTDNLPNMNLLNLTFHYCSQELSKRGLRHSIVSQSEQNPRQLILASTDR